MLLRLLALTYILSAGAAQQHFYCNSSDTETIRESDFVLVTRQPTDTTYPPGLTCEFNAESDTGAFFVEILSYHASTALLIMVSGGRTLFYGSSLQDYQSSITTPTKSLQVRFDASGDYSNSTGVTMRVRILNSNGCPPEWIYLNGSCFGTSNMNLSLDFADAQRACNSMRSNLLIVPRGFYDRIGAFMRLLPGNLTSSYTWVGLTDRTSAGQYRHYWLDDSSQNFTSEISCISCRDSLCAHTGCSSYERCGSVATHEGAVRTIFLDRCNSTRGFACYMPPGGTDLYYRIPEVESVTVPSQSGFLIRMMGIAAGSVFAIGLASLSVYGCVRSMRA